MPPPQRDNDFMEDSDSDISIPGDEETSRPKVKSKGKGAERRKKNKGKGKAKDVSSQQMSLCTAYVQYVGSKRIHGRLHIRGLGILSRRMRRGVCRARWRIGWLEEDGKGE